MINLTYASSSSDVIHTVNIYPDGRITCSCRGYDMPNKCWHVRDAKDGGLKSIEGGLVKQLYVGDIVPNAEDMQKVLTDSRVSSLPPAPTYIKPMKASALDEEMDIEDYVGKPGWVLEEKYDGHRMLVTVKHHPSLLVVHAYSSAENRRLLPPQIMKALQNVPDGTYDGELFWPGGTSTDVTRTDIQHELVLALFDMMMVGTQGCMHLKHTERRQLLEAATEKLHPNCYARIAPQLPVTKAGLEIVWARGGEGVIIKDTSCAYHPGKRIKQWVKFKKEQAAEITITGFLAGKLGPYSRIVGLDRHGVEVKAKTRNDAWRREFLKDPDAVIGKTLVIGYQDKTPPNKKTGQCKYRHPMADHIL